MPDRKDASRDDRILVASTRLLASDHESEAKEALRVVQRLLGLRGASLVDAVEWWLWLDVQTSQAWRAMSTADRIVLCEGSGEGLDAVLEIEPRPSLVAALRRQLLGRHS